MDTYGKWIGGTEDWAKLTAATSALLTGKDVSVAHLYSKTAVENNFLLAQVGVAAACVIYKAYHTQQFMKTKSLAVLESCR